MTEVATQRVERGATLLDQRVPGWHERVDVHRLRLISTADCVLGQLFGHYDVDEAVALAGDEDFDEFAARHGFDVDAQAHGDLARVTTWHSLQREVEAIEAAWVAAIAARHDLPDDAPYLSEAAARPRRFERG